MAAVVVVGVDGGGALQVVHLSVGGVGARVRTAAILPTMVVMRVWRQMESTMLVGNAGAMIAMSSRVWETRAASAWLVDMVGVWMLQQMEAVRMIRPTRAMAMVVVGCWWSACWRGRASIEASMAARLPTRWA